MFAGNYVLILHTHLPWVLNHGSWPHGEHWLFEAAAECYIPLMNVFNDLMEEGIRPGISIDISPVLCEQLAHPSFPDKFIAYCDEMIGNAARDEREFTDKGYDPHHIYLSKFWQEWYDSKKDDFVHKYKKSIIGAMRKLQDENAIEILTCGATHGYLPLLGYDESINLQVKASVENYKKHFGREPRGTWLPECAYRPSYEWKSYIPVAPFNEKRLRPGIEQFLNAWGINHFVSDQKLLEGSSPIGKFHSHYRKDFESLKNQNFQFNFGDFDKSPLKAYNVCSSDQVQFGNAFVFVRHREISMQVWSGEVGYPGESDYLDFHKKHMDSLLRYWRVTDNKADMMYKTLYHPDRVWKKLDNQSNHFIHNIENTLNWEKNTMGRNGFLCTPFDTELFGHWWFEGPEFLRYVLKGIYNSPYVHTATTSEEIHRTDPREVISLPEGSWGVKNTHEVWINEDNKWTWEAIYNDENRLKKILSENPINEQSPEFKRIMNQALREMMLEQSSDWQFLIYTYSAKDYAEHRFSYHHSDFNRLCDMAEKNKATGSINKEDELYLSECEVRNPVFQEINSEWWQPLKF